MLMNNRSSLESQVLKKGMKPIEIQKEVLWQEIL
jgi:hypothetical protein